MRRKLNNTFIENKNWLLDQYVTKRKSTVQIAREQSVNDETIREHLIKYDIQRRSAYETTANHVNLSPKLLELLEGNLLGDGCLHLRNKSAVYVHTSKYEGYLQWLCGLLGEYDIKISGGIHYYEKKWAGTYNVRTKYYREFKILYNKWYPEGKKIVPHDLKLTPTIILHWFLGDGCYAHKGTRYHRVEFAVNCFSKQDRKFLIDCFNKYDIYPTLPNNDKLCINISDLYLFFSIMLCPIEIRNIYGYKWPNNEEVECIKKAHERKLFLNKYRNINWLNNMYYDAGLSQAKIAKSIGISAPTIVNWMKQFDISPNNIGGGKYEA